MKTLQLILDWSEVWALLIPLIVLLIHRKQPHYLKPIIVYVIAALLLNIISDIIGDYYKHFPPWLKTNTGLYNVHSLIRFACVHCFFILLDQPFTRLFKKTVPILFFLFLIVNFTFFESVDNTNHISGNLLTAEAFLLLVYCLRYYLYKLAEDTQKPVRKADFWIVTGLGVYVVINFFIFLFYVPMIAKDPDLANKMWTLHNIAYIILCIFIAKAFSRSPRE